MKSFAHYILSVSIGAIGQLFTSENMEMVFYALGSLGLVHNMYLNFKKGSKNENRG